jgi:hypothetical protein
MEFTFLLSVFFHSKTFESIEILTTKSMVGYLVAIVITFVGNKWDNSIDIINFSLDHQHKIERFLILLLQFSNNDYVCYGIFMKAPQL